MNNLPLISIIIPVYNNESLLRRSLESVINQTYTNLEIIIISDGSMRPEVIKKIIKNFHTKNIIYIQNEINRGVSYVLNQAINIAKGVFINWLSHDDFFHEDKINLQYNDLIINNADISYTNFIQIKNNKHFYIKSINLNKSSNQYISMLLNDNIHGCSILLRSSIIKDNNLLFDTKLKHVQDYDFWLKIIKNYKFRYLNKFLLYSHVHEAQSSIVYFEQSMKEKKSFWGQVLSNIYGQNFKKIIVFKIIVSLSKRNYLDFYQLNNFNKNFLDKYIFKFAFFIGYCLNIIKISIKKTCKIIKV